MDLIYLKRFLMNFCGAALPLCILSIYVTEPSMLIYIWSVLMSLGFYVGLAIPDHTYRMLRQMVARAELHDLAKKCFCCGKKELLVECTYGRCGGMACEECIVAGECCPCRGSLHGE